MGGPASSIFILLGLIAALCLPIGLLLLLLGWRGKRTGNFPSCGSCGFDVSGLATDDTCKCPECGNALAHNVKMGRRRKRIAMLIAGVLLLAIPSSFGALLLFRGGWTNWNASKPNFLLKADIALGGKFQDAALSELKTRIGIGQLSRSNTNDLVQQALAWQADKSRTWVPGFGEVLETARGNGLVSDSDWLQFIFTATNPEIEVTATITQGDRIAFWLKSNPALLSDNAGVVANLSAIEVRIDGAKVNGWSDHWRSEIRGGRYGGVSANSMLDSSKLLPGTHEVQATLKVQLAEKSTQSTAVRVVRSFEVLPVGSASHRVKTDPALREQVERGITIDKLIITELDAGNARVEIMVKLSSVPVTTAFDVFLKLNGPGGNIHEYKIGSATTLAESKPNHLHATGLFADLKIDREALIQLSVAGETQVEMRPSLEAAKRRVNMYEIWGTPLTIQSKVTVNLANPAPK